MLIDHALLTCEFLIFPFLALLFLSTEEIAHYWSAVLDESDLCIPEALLRTWYKSKVRHDIWGWWKNSTIFGIYRWRSSHAIHAPKWEAHYICRSRALSRSRPIPLSLRRPDPGATLVLDPVGIYPGYVSIVVLRCSSNTQLFSYRTLAIVK